MALLTQPWALAALPVLAVCYWLRRRRPGPALGIPDGDAAAAAVSGPGLSWLPGACRIAGLCLAVLALAGPRLGPETVTWHGRGVDIMLAVDLSESMAAMDFRQTDRSLTRLAAVTEVAKRFAAARPGDRIGLIAFGTRAHTVMPPTADHTALVSALDGLVVGAAGKRTALGDALVLAVRHLAEAPGRAKVVVVFTDGRSNVGEVSPEDAAHLAADQGVSIQAVGVGGDAPAPFLVDHPLLGPEIVYEKADIDIAGLEDLARITGGAFWRAADTAGLDTAIRRIDAREPSDMVATRGADQPSPTPALAAVASLLLTAYAVLGASRFARLP
jgi:Ca-activated chloride channel homolog